VSVGFLSQGSSTLQIEADPTMRGRVVALWAVAFQGTTPIGGPIAGVVSEQFGGRAGLLLAAMACAAAAGVGWLIARRPTEIAGRRADAASDTCQVQQSDCGRDLQVVAAS